MNAKLYLAERKQQKENKNCNGNTQEHKWELVTAVLGDPCALPVQKVGEKKKKVFPNKENLPLQTKNLEAELGARAF